MTDRYVHGPIAGADDPVAWYVGASTDASALRYLFADERGSIVAVTNSAGARIAINSYDGSEAERAPRGQYGIPGSGNLGRSSIPGRSGFPNSAFRSRMFFGDHAARHDLGHSVYLAATLICEAEVTL